MERHIRFLVEYDGTDYAGFQWQKNANTIQAELKAALRKCLKHEASVAAAGRTDAGVHASGQVCTFRTTNRIPVERIPLALNRLLPRAIVVRAAREVGPDFHPRFSATSRVYRYTIDNQPIPSALTRRYAHHVHRPLDVAAMRRAARGLVGRHDFASFQASGSAMGGTVREMRHLEIKQRAARVAITIEANAFLYQMVRIIVGTLIQVGLGDRPSRDLTHVLAARDRTAAGPTAPPHGLCLVRVKYDRVLRRGRPRGRISKFDLAETGIDSE